MQRLFAHRARQFVADHLEDFFFDVICDVDPGEGVHGAFGLARVFLETLLQQPDDGAFCAADRAVQQNHAALRPVVPGGGFEDIDQMGEALIDTVNRIAPIVGVIPEEAVARDLLLVLDVLLDAVREDHVVNPLERVPRDARTVLNELEIVLERSFPIQFLVFLCALKIRDRAENVYGLCLVMHILHLYLTPVPPR